MLLIDRYINPFTDFGFKKLFGSVKVLFHTL
jgi:hypothetical protein